MIESKLTLIYYICEGHRHNKFQEQPLIRRNRLQDSYLVYLEFSYKLSEISLHCFIHGPCSDNHHSVLQIKFDRFICMLYNVMSSLVY